MQDRAPGIRKCPAWSADARANKSHEISGRNALSAGAEPQARVASAPSARREHIPLAIFFMIASGAVFNCANAASKWLVASYPIGEVLFSRSLVALLTMALFILPASGWMVF